ncbi:hypothetical protein N0O92_09060 [Alkalihalobacillus sp. MEB130]|uniref:hypothetical protein n=1 Tax=Alkalihalobacillus sp. MEB130 TaxID=2976704 RepID=UPI0028DD5D99|nr:hypothetical protein [Alkalihalobacillus sp. MEB130]MDT8860382.1 hypothetical protein [Alkalihalobacillus sp. MEB130]
MDKKFAFKQSGVFLVAILLLTLFNIGYVSIEIYKSSMSQPMVSGSTITEAEFSRLSTLSQYALILETAFLILIILNICLTITKRNKLVLIGILLHLGFLIVLFSVNTVIAAIFHAPVGNMRQIVYIPFIIVGGAASYVVLRHVMAKRGVFSLK